ncbi:DoxX family membrane protein [Actinomadura rudentiformis]|uniref:DoxX family membrane protein n=1 Tax=Actinomadura rudentiformis TaxID=359158 RepID=A0A6H9Z6B8_9ACTN|nr:DoxX family membrane protein [Actinomadura rudentiformis]KAB2350320.1 DoxX family membrane protein [Actinomadura rudentiformis]
MTTHLSVRAPDRDVLSDPGYQAYLVLRVVFSVAPVVFGLDKFTGLLADWPSYLAPWINDLVPGTAQQAMYAVGVVEIVAGIVVAVAPRFGGLLVAAWLAGIIVNLLTIPDFYDVALRDAGLLAGAVALSRLAVRYRSVQRERGSVA